MKWYKINGDNQGLDCQILLMHKNGSFFLGWSNWVGDNMVQPYPQTKPTIPAYVDTLEDGYVAWCPIIVGEINE